jgi:hypothetical protein
LGGAANAVIEIEHSSNMAKTGETSLFGKCMAKTHKIINTVMVDDGWAQGMSQERFTPGRANALRLLRRVALGDHVA